MGETFGFQPSVRLHAGKAAGHHSPDVGTSHQSDLEKTLEAGASPGEPDATAFGIAVPRPGTGRNRHGAQVPGPPRDRRAIGGMIRGSIASEQSKASASRVVFDLGRRYGHKGVAKSSILWLAGHRRIGPTGSDTFRELRSGLSFSDSHDAVIMKSSQAKPLTKIEVSQLRAARALLGWSQQELACRAGISARTIAAIESAATKPKAETIGRLASCLEEAGIRFSRTREFWPQVALRPSMVDVGAAAAKPADDGA